MVYRNQRGCYKTFIYQYEKSSYRWKMISHMRSVFLHTFGTPEHYVIVTLFHGIISFLKVKNTICSSYIKMGLWSKIIIIKLGVRTSGASWTDYLNICTRVEVQLARRDTHPISPVSNLLNTLGNSYKIIKKKCSKILQNSNQLETIKHWRLTDESIVQICPRIFSE